MDLFKQYDSSEGIDACSRKLWSERYQWADNCDVMIDRSAYLRPHWWCWHSELQLRLSRVDHQHWMGSPHWTQPSFPDHQRPKTCSGWLLPASSLLPSFSERKKMILAIFVSVGNNSDLFSFEPPHYRRCIGGHRQTEGKSVQIEPHICVAATDSLEINRASAHCAVPLPFHHAGNRNKRDPLLGLIMTKLSVL